MAESRVATASSSQACQSFGSWERDREDYEQGPGVSPCARCAETALSLTRIVSRGFVSEPVR